MIPNLAQNKSNCCCCRACANVCPKNAISFEKDENGFLYPCINENLCVGCGLCEKTCNFKKDTVGLREPIKAYAAINKDKEVLLQSTSGGAFSVLADIVFEKCGTVFGATMDENLRVKHICVEESEQLYKLRGSKYVLSDIGFCYKQAKEKLDKGEYVLFTGTPCQIAGLYAVLKYKDYDNLLTADIVCHGTPSQAMFDKFVQYLEEKHKTKIKKFNFRNKKRTWLRFQEEFTNSDDQIINIGKFDEFYHPCFVSGHLIQEGCHHCPYAKRERVADFTLCDFWGFDKAKLKLKENDGLSAIMFNSPKSLNYEGMIQKRMQLERVDYNIVVDGNRCLQRPTPKGSFWEYYMEAYRNDTIREAAEQYITNRKEFIKKQQRLFALPYPFYKFYRFGMPKIKNFFVS